MDPSEENPAQQPDRSAEPEYSHRRTGKIARLPKDVRDRLNLMLLDGLPYAEILASLGDRLKGVTENNLSRWSTGGYQDWLKQQQRLAETRARQEVAIDLACEVGGSRIHEASLQLAATSLAEIVRDLDFTDLKEMLREDPSQVIPFLNALARISDSEIRCERHRLDLDQRKSPCQVPLASQKGLKPETRQHLERELNIL